jgi:hypothetical protein
METKINSHLWMSEIEHIKKIINNKIDILFT